MSTHRPLYRVIAETLGALKRCQDSNNTIWRDKWDSLLEHIESNLLPSGAGIDNGTKIDRDRSSEAKLVLTCGYHHMNDAGMYDGWTEHTITILPSFSGIDIRISGRNRNDIKDYLAETYDHVLCQIVDTNSESLAVITPNL